MQSRSIVSFFRGLFNFLVLLSLLLSAVYAGNVPVHAEGTGRCYVDRAALGADTGITWTDAYKTLQQALADSCTEIWVAAGVYTPGSSRTDSFTLKSGVGVYGGFDANETQRDQRDWAAHVTTLSGDIGVVDDPADNSYHVVTGSGTDNTAVLDGFTITGGNADGEFPTNDWAAGMINVNGSPTLTHLVFTGNHALSSGGGIGNVSGSSPHLTHATFTGNVADADGGGAMSNNGSSPTLTDVTFSSNSTGAGFGGAIFNENNCTPTLDGVTFSGNNAYKDGGAIVSFDNCNLSLTDVTFTGNTATGSGGAMSNTNSSATLTNVNFSGNTATGAGGAMQNNNSSPTLTGVTFEGNITGDSGGGMMNYNHSSPILTDVTFTNNSITGQQVEGQAGGGMDNETYSSPTLLRVTFTGNSSTDSGGGMLNYDNSSPSLTDVTFNGNSAPYGGGLYNGVSSSPTLTNVTFTGNIANGDSSTSGGGMYNHANAAILTNVTFTNNHAGSGSGAAGGGAMFNTDASPTLNHVTFSGNTSEGTDRTGGMENRGTSSPTIDNTIVWGAGLQFAGEVTAAPAIRDSIVPGGCPSDAICTHVIDANPMLLSLADNGGETQTMALNPASAAIDAGGQNSTCADTDQRGVARPQGPACDIGAYESQATPIVANLLLNEIYSEKWPLGDQVTVTVDSAANGTGVDYTDSGTVEASPSGNPALTWISFSPSTLILKPDDLVIMTNESGTITRQLEVMPIEITRIETGTDIVSGTSDPAKLIHVRAQDGSGNWSYRDVQANGEGGWSANFSQAGTEFPEQQSVVDIVAKTPTSASVDDTDFDHTEIDRSAPNARFHAQIVENKVVGYDWPVGQDVTLTIDDPSTGANPDLTRTLPVEVGNPDSGIGMVVFDDLGTLALAPLMTVTMENGAITKTLTVSNLAVSGVDPATDTVWGTGDPGARINVIYCPEECLWQRWATIQPDHTWSVDFSEVGPLSEEKVLLDIVPGMSGAVIQPDGEDDHTEVAWYAPKTWFIASLRNNRVDAFDWPLGHTVTLEIDDPSTVTDPDFTYAGTASADPAMPVRTLARFNIVAYSLHIGDVVTVSDGSIAKTHTIANIGITEVDINNDVVSGTVESGFTQVWVRVSPSETAASRWVEVVDGQWIADFHVPGDDPYNEAQTWDIGENDMGLVRVDDADGDSTDFPWFSSVIPAFIARLTENRVEAYAWPVSTDLEVTVDADDDPDNGVLTTVHGRVDELNLAEGGYSGNISLDPYALKIGDHVTVSGGGYTRHTEVPNLVVTGVDIDNDIVSGTVQGFTQVRVRVHTDAVRVARTVDVVGGQWIANFHVPGDDPENEAETWDIVPGNTGYVAVDDVDGDTVSETWKAQYPILAGSSISGVVKDLDGNPVAGVSIQVTAEDASGEVGGYLATACSEPGTGAYTLTDLPAGFSFAVSAGGDATTCNSDSSFYGWEYWGHASDLAHTAPIELSESNLHAASIDLYVGEAVPYIEYLVFNMQNPVMDLAVRQAIAYATDRLHILDTAWSPNGQYGTLQNSCVPENHWAAATPGNSELPTYPYDPDRARSLLQADGWILNAETGIREKEGVPLTLHFKTTGNQVRRDAGAIFVQEMHDIGIQVVPTYMGDGFYWPSQALLSDLEDGDFDIAEYAVGFYCLNTLDGKCVPLPMYYAGDAWNYARYASAAAEAEYDAAQAAPTREERLPHAIAHQVIAMTDLPYLPLFTRVQPRTISGYAGLEGVTLTYMVSGAIKTVTSGNNGSYSLTIPLGWSGTVTPSKSATTFLPPERTYSAVRANQADQDFNAYPKITAEPDQGWTYGEGWPDGSTVTLIVDDDNNAGNGTLHQESKVVSESATWDPYPTLVRFNPEPAFDLLPGQYVTFTDGTTARTLRIRDVHFDFIDVAQDIAGGRGPALLPAYVWIKTAGGQQGLDVTIDSSGNWSADFGAAGFDITQDIQDSYFHVFEADGNGTMAHWTNPYVSDADEDGLPDLTDPCPEDATNTCNSAGSGAAVIPPSGGTLTTPNGNTEVEIPAGAIDTQTSITITDNGSGFVISTDQAELESVASAHIGPSGTAFAVPVSLTFSWPDANDDGIVDGAGYDETLLQLSKDGVVIAVCSVGSACDFDANTITVHVSSLSEFVVGAPANHSPEVNAATFTVDEHAANGTAVGTVTYGDAETGQGHSCSIQDGNSSSAFVINASTCAITVNTSSALVYSLHPSFTLTVRVTDDGTPPRHGDATITVNLIPHLPAVRSIVRANGNPTNAATVSFTATFTESVTGVGADDFQLYTSGLSATSIHQPTGSGAVYTVTVDTGLGDGTLRLDLTDNDSIVDGDGNPLGGTGAGNANFTGGETYTIDHTPPDTSITSGPNDPSDSANATFVFTSPDPSATFKCNLDSGTEAACTSPKAYAALADGPHTFSVQAGDPAGNADPSPAAYTWTIDTNAPPVITEGATRDVTMSEDGLPAGFVLTLHATDPNGDTLTWSISQQGQYGIAAASGIGPSKVIGYTPAANYNGSDSFIVQVSDGRGDVDAITVNVTISPVNDAPVIAEGATRDLTMSEDGDPTPFALTLNAGDVDGDTLTWSISGPAGHGIAAASGTGASASVGYAPNANYNGSDGFIVHVSDGKGGADTITINVTIAAVNDPPVITEGYLTAVMLYRNGTPVPFALTLHAADNDADILTWSIPVGASGLHGVASIAAPATGASHAIVYTPNADYVGPDSFVVEVSDGHGGTDTITVNVTVVAPPGDIALSASGLSENRLAGTVVGALSTTGGIGPYAYSLVGGDAACNAADNLSFQIDAGTNQLKTAAMFDYESRSSYSICVQTKDSHDAAALKHFVISVSDLPETFLSAGGQDGWILESTETSGAGGTLNAGAATFNLGDDAANKQYRAILSFNTKALPDNAVVQSVVLKIKQSGGPMGLSPFKVLDSLLVDIRKPYFGTAGSLQLADFKAAASSSKVGTFNKIPSSGWYSVTLNLAGRNNINRTGLTQLRLRFSMDDNNNLLANYMKFFSGNSGIASYRPTLVIQYHVP